MAKVENPSFEAGLECEECPLFELPTCSGIGFIFCPRNTEEYAEACKLAEQEAAK